MERPSYLSKYLFDWDLIEVMLDGRSAIDSKFFVGQVNNVEEANNFLKGYGLDPNDLVSKSELFGNFQESLQFIRRYFLKEGLGKQLDRAGPRRAAAEGKRRDFEQVQIRPRLFLHRTLEMP